jgi:nucleotide-binding universal stress UspA family protein
VYEHILIATDGSHVAHKAVATGIALAQSLGARVTALAVTEPPTNLVPESIIGATYENEHDAKQYPAVTEALGTVRDQAEAASVPCTTVHVCYQYPAETIVEIAEARGCDLIVMASHGRRGLARLLLGGEAVRVLTHAAVPVLVCR